MIVKMNYTCDFSEDQLVSIVEHQLLNFFPIKEAEKELLKEHISFVIDKSHHCFQNIENKYMQSGVFSPFHSGQWLIFLYYYSNKLSSVNKTLADKLYYLNKIMNGIDIFHEVNLPDVFYFEHPLGSIFGRGHYGNYFSAMQGCTVGGNRDRLTGKIIYPVIGEHVQMFSNSKIIGNSKIGNNVKIAANTYVKDMDIPDNATVFGMSPNITIKFL